MGLLVANKKWFDKLTQEERDMIVRACAANIAQQRKFVAEKDEKIIKYLGEHGMSVYRLSASEVAGFKKVSLSVHDEFAKLSPAEAVALETVRKSLSKFGPK